MKYLFQHLKHIILLVIALSSNWSYAQTDTLWYSSNGKGRVKADTIFYGFEDGIQVIDGEIHLNKNQYYLNGTLRKEICTPNTILSFNHRTLKTKYYNPEGVFRTVVETRFNEFWNIEKVYYDENGKEVGRSRKQKDGKVNGKDIDYYFDDVLTIKEVTETKDDITTKTRYYKSGQVANKIVETKTEKTEVAYNKAGEQIAQLTYTKGRSWKVEDGKKMIFDYYLESPLGYDVYKDGKIVENRRFQELYFDFPGWHSFDRGDSSYTYYDFNGEPLDTFVEYQGESHGTLHLDSPGKIETYRNDSLIAYTEYNIFWRGQVKETLKDNIVTYYNKTGTLLGTLKQSPSGLPLDGRKYTYYFSNDLKNMFDYKDGKLIRTTQFGYHPETYEQYTMYTSEDDSITGYFFNGNVKYHSLNGGGYQYYTATGDTLPRYDEKLRGKVSYHYFAPPYDHLLKEKVVKRDEKVMYIKAWFKPEKPVEVQDSCKVHFVYKHTGINYLYNEQGEEIEKIARRYGKVDLNDHDIFRAIIKHPETRLVDVTYDVEGTMTINVWNRDIFGRQKNTQYKKIDDRNGPFKHYDYYSGRLSAEGTYKYHKLGGEYKAYYKTGKLKEQSHYSYGQLHGVKTFHDPNGGQTYELLYKNGYPYSGYKPDNLSGLLDVYHTGVHINKMALTDYNPSKSDRIIKDEMLELIDPETQVKYASAIVKNEAIEGTITYYNPKGKHIYKGVYKDGVLKGGHVFFEIYEHMGMPDENGHITQNEMDYLLVHLTYKDHMYTATFYSKDLTVKNKVKLNDYTDIFYSKDLTVKNKVKLNDYTDIIELIKNKTGEESIYNSDTKGYEYNELKNLKLTQPSLDILFNPTHSTLFQD